jgi:aspartate carbamoyltransferase catalytic subunit
MNHLIDINDLSAIEIEALIDSGCEFKKNKSWPKLSSSNCSMLFYENSTRTRVSFELAAKYLKVTLVNIDVATSSVNKGESVLDTMCNLQAMGFDYFIVRHQQEKLPQFLIENMKGDFHLINAGSGKEAHPSQALLDAMTIYQYKKVFSGLKIAILGDIKHSRVANSLIQILTILGVKSLYLISPASWQRTDIANTIVTDDIEYGLSEADVIVCLRIQKERLEKSDVIDFDEYQQNYSLTIDKLQLAQKDAIVMHPGPINRGLEISSQVADCSQSVILEQVNNGVFMRMAILNQLSKS